MPLIANADEIKRRADVVDIIGRRIPLRPSRARHLEGNCPFHRSASGRSFHVYPEKNTWYCWGCHEGGSAISFIMKYENCDYPAALEMAASESRVTVQYQHSGTAHEEPYVPRQDLNAAVEAACTFYERQIMEERNKNALEYMLNRGFTLDMLKKYRIGYAFGSSVSSIADKEALTAAGVLQQGTDGLYRDPLAGRITIPILDNVCRPCGFTGRLLENNGSAPKYKNTNDTPIFQKGRTLFGWAQCREMYHSVASKPRQLYIVEGQLKAIAMLENGYPAIAAGGTGFTEQQVAMIARLSGNVAILPDPDQAGMTAALRTARALRTAAITVSIANLDRREADLKDPDDFMAAKLQIRISEQPFLEWLYMSIIGPHIVQSPDQAKAVSENILPIVREHPLPAVATYELRRLALMSGIPESALQDTRTNTLPMAAQPTPEPQPQTLDTNMTPERSLLAAILQTFDGTYPNWPSSLPLLEMPAWITQSITEIVWAFRFSQAKNLPLADAIEAATPPSRRPYYMYWLMAPIAGELTQKRCKEMAMEIAEDFRNKIAMQSAEQNMFDFSTFIQNWRPE